MTFNIRTASFQDIPLLIELQAGIDGESCLPNALAEEIFAAIIKIPNYKIYLIIQNNQPIGTFSLLQLPAANHQGNHKYAVLDTVTMRPKLCDREIGRQMLETAMKLSADAGCEKLMLSSNLKRESARQLYQSLEFEHGELVVGNW